jgi:hypothetical protein
VKESLLAVLLWLPVLAGASARLCAQEFGVGATADWNTGGDMVPLGGLLATARFGRAPLVFSAEVQRGDKMRPDVLCAGLIPPGYYCPVEPTRFDIRVVGGSLGYRIRLGGSPRAQLHLEPRLGLVQVRERREGRETGRRGEDATMLVRAAAEVRGAIRLIRAIPLYGSVAGRVARAFDPLGLDCVDCYVPSFKAGYTGVGASVGISLDLD